MTVIVTDLSTNVDPIADFNNKIKERIRESIGDLMPDELLTKIVEDNIKACFFTDIARSSYNGTVVEKRSVAYDLVKELLDKRVNEAVTEYFRTNKDEIIDIVKNQVNIGMGRALVDGITNIFRNDLYSFANGIETRLRNL